MIKITQTLAIKTRELGPKALGQEYRGNDVEIKTILQQDYVIALIKFEKDLGSAALDKIGNIGAFKTLQETARQIPTEQIIKEIISVDYAKYPHLHGGIDKTLQRLDSTIINQSNGAVHEISNIAHKLNRGVNITDIQYPIPSKELNGLGERILDYVIKEGDTLIHVDVKAWAPKTIRSFLPLKG